MIEITSQGKSHDLKVIESESGVDLTRLLTDIRIEWDLRSHRLVAVLTVAPIKLDIKAVTKYVLKELAPRDAPLPPPPPPSGPDPGRQT